MGDIGAIEEAQPLTLRCGRARRLLAQPELREVSGRARISLRDSCAGRAGRRAQRRRAARREAEQARAGEARVRQH